MLRLLPPPTDAHDAYDSEMRSINQILIARAYEVLWLNLNLTLTNLKTIAK